MKRILFVILSLTLILGLGISAAAQTQAADTHNHTDTAVESQGPTGTYIKVADGLYVRDPNAPAPRWIPSPYCFDCYNAKFVTAKNTFIYNNAYGCLCPTYYNGHACYYCGTQYVDELWINHKSNCDNKDFQWG